MKVVIIDQARMSSTRLPGKVLKTVNGKSLLEYQIERLKRVKSADEVVIATTTNPADRSIVELCERLNVPCVCGPEEDVLARYDEAARFCQADLVVRITSDCPLIDPQVVDRVIKFFLDHNDHYDYVSNCLEESFPRGMDTEVFPVSILNEAFQEAITPADREHVTPFIYTHPQRYRLGNVSYTRDESHNRLTVDTPEDFELIAKIIESLYPVNPHFSLEDILSLIRRNSHWTLINSAVRQKRLDE